MMRRHTAVTETMSAGTLNMKPASIQSRPKNEQSTATTKLLLAWYSINKQSRRDAVTTEMIPGPCIRELGIKFDYDQITGFATMLQYHH